jgi:GTP-binding protein EngB required for normal cell division
LEQAKAFIETKRTAKLADQIHAIWYLIDCSSNRPIQGTDEEFFAGKLFDTGEIPIFIVITNYDKLVKSFEDDDEEGATEEEIEKQADDYVKKEVETDIKALIKDHSKFSFCRVGLKRKGPEYMPKYHGKDGKHHNEHLHFSI